MWYNKNKEKRKVLRWRLRDERERLLSLRWAGSEFQFEGPAYVKTSSVYEARSHHTSMICKHSTNPVPDCLQEPRKNQCYLPFNFWQKSFTTMMSNLQSYPTTVLHERMWHFRGRNTLWYVKSPAYFQGVKTPTPKSTSLCSTARPSRHKDLERQLHMEVDGNSTTGTNARIMCSTGEQGFRSLVAKNSSPILFN